ncbi:MAG: Do family serine endopeptidase [Gammaproteobacteria bacterium]
MKSTALTRPGLTRTALFAVPLALGLLLVDAVPSTAATPAPAPAFERVQFADVIEATQPAVVQITVSKTVEQASAGNGAFERFMRRFGARPFDGPLPFSPAPYGQPRQATGVGSGFIIDDDGHIVTNNHVIDGASEMTVALHDGREFQATLVGSDPQTDLAVIKIDGVDLPTIAFGDSDRARVGDWVVAIGSPFGFGGSVTAGIISARGRDIRSGPYDDYLQIDAPINSGNSGGPIIDASGRVIGVNTAIFSPNGGNIGIGFAIPAIEAERVVAALKADGAVTRGWLGVQVQDVTEDVAAALGLDEAGGALVAEVVDDAPAARAGLRAGDVITRFGDTAIEDPRDLSRAVARVRPGTRVELEVLRKGRSKHLSAQLAENRQALAAAAPRPDRPAEDTLGLGLALGAIDEGSRRRMGIGDDVDGALVLGIKSGGAAENGGLRPGDVIVQIDQKDVHDVAGATSALAAARREGRPSVVLIRRGDEQFFTTMNLA